MTDDTSPDERPPLFAPPDDPTPRPAAHPPSTGPAAPGLAAPGPTAPPPGWPPHAQPTPVPGHGPTPPDPVPGAPAAHPRVEGYPAETYYAPGWQPPQPGMDALAVWSIPAGLLAGPVGVALGIAGLTRTRRRGTRGRTLAVVGIVVGALVTTAWIAGAWLVFAGAAARVPLPADVAAPRTANARQLVLGNCLAQLPPNGDVTRVDVVPCGDEHRAQVVARTDFAADALWPGQDAASRRVAQVCGAEVLGPTPPTGVERVVWAPSEASWNDGDRTGLCLAWSEEPLPESLVD